MRLSYVGRAILAPAVFATLLALPLRAAAETWSFRCSNGVQFALLNAYRPRYEQREPPVILSYRGKQYLLYPFTGGNWWGFFANQEYQGVQDTLVGYGVGFYTTDSTLEYNNVKIGTQCREIAPRLLSHDRHAVLISPPNASHSHRLPHGLQFSLSWIGFRLFQ